MNRYIVKLTFSVLASLTLMFPVSALASAGKAIFVYGKAYTVAANGERQTLVTGDAIESGDTVLTTSNGRVQLQMADGGLIALRPGSELIIEDFSYPQGDDEDPFTAGDEPRSFFALVKGGLRSITGVIGKENKANYRVTTPVATIGIRGTDFDLVYCASDCQVYSKVLSRHIADGLYVGVNSGGVNVTTSAGSLDLDRGEFGFVRDARSVPVSSNDAKQLLAPATQAEVTDQSVDSSESSVAQTSAPDTGVAGTDGAGDSQNLINGGDEVAQGAQSTLAVSSFSGERSTVYPGAVAGVIRDQNSDVVGFASVNGDVTLDSSSPVNVGRDAERENATGLSWGRWAEGSDVSVNGTAANLDQSVHYIVDEAGATTPVLPTTGNLEFELIGNTDPTDNRGNVGALGSANLSADFTSQTVDADVSLSFQETAEVWTATAQDVDINSTEATFAGEFDQVTVVDADVSSDASGDLSGFFTGDQNGDVNGAGMTFSLSEGDTEVNGSAAFQTRD